MNRGDIKCLGRILEGDDDKNLNVTIFNSEVNQTKVFIGGLDGKVYSESLVTNRDNLRQFAQDIISDLDALDSTSQS